MAVRPIGIQRLGVMDARRSRIYRGTPLDPSGGLNNHVFIDVEERESLRRQCVFTQYASGAPQTLMQFGF